MDEAASIARAAALLIREHGPNAASIAEKHAQGLQRHGSTLSAEVWLKIVEEIRRLQGERGGAA
jgi:hypothetical protein